MSMARSGEDTPLRISVFLLVLGSVHATTCMRESVDSEIYMYGDGFAYHLRCTIK